MASVEPNMNLVLKFFMKWEKAETVYSAHVFRPFLSTFVALHSRFPSCAYPSYLIKEPVCHIFLLIKIFKSCIFLY